MSVKVVNKTDTRMIFSLFNKGDDFAPFSHTWVEANGTADLDNGNFQSIGIGAQVQSGGVWVGGSPKDGPFGGPGQTFTFTVTKAFSL